MESINFDLDFSVLHLLNVLSAMRESVIVRSKDKLEYMDEPLHSQNYAFQTCLLFRFFKP